MNRIFEVDLTDSFEETFSIDIFPSIVTSASLQFYTDGADDGSGLLKVYISNADDTGENDDIFYTLIEGVEGSGHTFELTNSLDSAPAYLAFQKDGYTAKKYKIVYDNVDFTEGTAYFSLTLKG